MTCALPMIEHPILFSGPMVRAILDGRKTMTRRIIKLPSWAQECNEDHEFELDGNPPWPHAIARKTGCLAPFDCPYGQTGDNLFVRETGWERPYRTRKMMRDGADTWEPYYYDADGLSETDREEFKQWGFKRRPSIFMPRRASRITLELTGVRVEQLQEISGEDAKAEGAEYYVGGHGLITESELRMEPGYWHGIAGYQQGFQILWDSINAKRAPWASNPFVWVLTFKRLNAAIKE